MFARLFRSALLLAVIPATVAPLRAQEARGFIVGRVTDATGAVVPRATVDVISKSMGTKVSITTTEAGAYQAAFLIPGSYRIEAQAAGFKKFVRDNVEVRVNDRVEIEILLEVGAAEQSITVTEESPLLNTASASLGGVIDARRVQDLPVAHGNPFQLIGLAAGVAFTRDARLDRPFEPTHIVGYSIDGTRANRSDVTLDGVPTTATANNGEVIASYVPPPDIVAEFKVQTATFDASFGQTEGGVTNISIKSGTNEFHGTAYYNKMAPELFANDFFANANRIARPDFTYNRWGGTLGGPVRIPKLYDGRNKTFFMFGYEGIKESRPRNNGTPTVATPAMKTGDFSSLLAYNTSYQIYNPFTRRAVAGGRFQQDPFPGNIIPSSLINPVAANIQKYFADPLSPGNPDGSNNFQNPALLEKIDYGTYTVRVDQNVGQNQRLFMRVSWYDRDSNYNNYFNNLSTGEWFQFVSRNAVLDDVITLTPTTVLNFRYGYNRFIRATLPNPEARGFDLTSLGFPAAYNNSIPVEIRRFPRIDIAGYQGTAGGGEWRPNDLHSFNTSLQHTRGAHFIKGGMEFRSYRETRKLFANDQTGRFNFDTTWTRGPLDNSPTAPGSFGQSYAAFLLGLPSESNSLLVRQPDYAEQSLSWGFFVHDDWKVNSRLTLNLGLRYEFENPMTERYDRSVRGFDFGYIPAFEAAVRSAYAANPTPEVPASQFNTRGGLLFSNVDGQPRGVYNTPKDNIMPRIGFAYRVNAKTVVRGGYGIFYGFLGQRRGDVIQTGWSANTPFVPSRDNGLTFSSTLSNPFPGGIIEPVGNANRQMTFMGQSVTFFDENPLNSYMQRWQIGVQREFGKNLVFELSYVGNRGTHIELGQNLNVTPQRYLSTSPVRDNPTINYLSANLPNPFRNQLPAGAIAAFNAANIGRERLLRPFPHFDAVNHSRFDGYSWYHSLQMNIEKRFSQGYTVLGNYTYSKFMQASEVLNQDDARPVEVISDFDRPHRLTVSGIWDLPFGKGQKIGANVNPFGNALIAGWQLNGIYTYQSGSPLGFGNIIFNGDINNVALPRSQQTVDQWFNINAGFERTAALQLDRNVRTFPLRFGFIRAHHVNNYDLSVIKNNRIAERYNVQFRFEFLNALNRPQFPAPNTTPSVAAFGRIQASTQANYARRIQLGARLVF
jgi:hypothetical protein